MITTSVAIVYFDLWWSKNSKTIGRNFFTDKQNLPRPNSTLRLNAMNFAAWQNLAKDMSVSLLPFDAVQRDFDQLLSYDTIVLNTVAADRTIEFMKYFSQWWEERSPGIRLVFGTEFSWLNQVKAGRMARNLAEFPYRNGVLLRHTARTDREIYRDTTFLDAKIQEFPLGVDLAALYGVDGEAKNVIRDKILFVAGPEGRLTKNNDEIYAIETLIKHSKILKDLKVVVLKPPYRPTDYWDLLKTTKYMIFTSLGETFSYVFHDALALGVVCLRKPGLFATGLPRYGADSYPDVGVRYLNPEHAINELERLHVDESLTLAESRRSIDYVKSNHSLTALSSRWKKLLIGEDFSVNSVLIVGSADISLEESNQLMRVADAHVALHWRCRGLPLESISSYSYVSGGG